MRKLLLAVAVSLGLATSGQAVCDHRTTTCFTKVDVSGQLSAGSMTCSNISTSTLTAANLAATYGVTAATGTFSGTLSGSTPYVVRFSSSGVDLNTVPSTTGIIGVTNTTYLLYISTCATVSQCWVKVGAQ